MEKPILFNTEMVRAIMDGRKTMTRRIIKQEFIQSEQAPIQVAPGRFHFWCYGEVNCPYGQSGDILWVRETWQSFFPEEVTSNHQQGPRSFSGIPAESAKGHYMHLYYRADGEIEKAGWLPSIHMPRVAARLFLRVKNVRVERLQDITSEDIRSEGLTSMGVHCGDMGLAIPEWKILWNSTIKKQDLDKYGWDANPWVWVIEFERVEVKS